MQSLAWLARYFVCNSFQKHDTLQTPCGACPLRKCLLAHISGYVTDESGQPLVGARVQAVGRLKKWSGPYYEIPAGRPGESDDRGQFRLHSLPPGQYVVAVSVEAKPPTPEPGETTMRYDPLGWGFRATRQNYGDNGVRYHTMDDVLPGPYLAVAVDVEPYRLTGDTDLMERARRAAVRVEINEGDTRIALRLVRLRPFVQGPQN